MPIEPFLTEGVFDPEATRAMSVAFANACRSLGVRDASDPTTRTVAEKVIEAAKAGERDPVKLYKTVMCWAAKAA